MYAAGMFTLDMFPRARRGYPSFPGEKILIPQDELGSHAERRVWYFVQFVLRVVQDDDASPSAPFPRSPS